MSLDSLPGMLRWHLSPIFFCAPFRLVPLVVPNGLGRAWAVNAVAGAVRRLHPREAHLFDPPNDSVAQETQALDS
jgi:hypothetical protein